MTITDKRFIEMVEEYFDEQLKSGGELRISRSMTGQGPGADSVSVPDSPEIRDRIFFRLINPAENQEMLEQMPFMEFYDMAVVFYVLLKKQEKSQIVMPIRKEQQRQWDVSAQELFCIAQKNTPRLFPPVLKGISDILAEAVREEGKEKIKIQLPDFLKPDRELFYVLSTESCICGSTVLLYKNALQKITKWLNTDLVIIPSSIHEVLVMALNEWLDIRELKDLLHEVNREEVPEKERLSDHIYLYRREQGRLEMVRNMEF